MSSSAFRIRRATIDDLPTLHALWVSMRIPLADLDRRLTEFQVAERTNGEVVGAVGLQMMQRHALIHSEAFSDFGVADQVRPLFWQRLNALALNHGIVRFWTRENTPFWTHNGLQPADEETLKRLPAAWDPTAGGWLTLRLKDEDAIASLDKEFDLFVAEQRRQTAESLSGARKVKTVVAWLVGFAVLASLAYAVYLVLSGRINLRP